MKMAELERSRSRIPVDLYNICVLNIVNYMQKKKCSRNDLQALPDSILMDVYNKMWEDKRLCVLGAELSELNIFERLLRYGGTQLRLIRCFQGVVEHGSKLPAELAAGYLARCDAGTHTHDELIDFGLRLGGFLNEAGWYADAQRVLDRCLALCRAQPPSEHYKRLTLECCQRLLNTQSSYCSFPEAAHTYALSLQLLGLAGGEVEGPGAGGAAGAAALERVPEDELLDRLQAEWSPRPDETRAGGAGGAAGWRALLARLYKEFSALFFVRCDYSAAHRWSMRALRLLDARTPHRVSVEVLLACGKACVVKRRFERAGQLVRAAVALARRAFGPAHPRYAAALLDLGFYLLNVDNISRSVTVYEEALSVVRGVFGRSSLHVATAQEDLAYALYVLEYSSGRFYKARDHAERAINIIENLVPSDHLLLASAKRVKALILEEIALDTPAGQDLSEPSLLQESEALHMAALSLSMKAFGENNVQTAKHYGNLGRLYQSMQKFEDAEAMHLKAIAIKEALLGPEDYEVGLSIGHLASLYNYHMNMHVAAEKLYKRSIAISLKLFGERYSGLEYDYRGLVHVFSMLKQTDQAEHYERLLHHWHQLRERSRQEPQPPVGEEHVMTLEELQANIFGTGH